MRNTALTLLAFITSLISASASQLNSEIIRGTASNSEQVVRLNAAQQIVLDPSTAGKQLGLPSGLDLRLQATETDQLGVNYRFTETLGTIPIDNTMYIIQTKNGKMTVLSGVIITELDPSREYLVNPAITPKQAVAAAIGIVNAQRYAWEDETMEQQLKESGQQGNRPLAELMWFSGLDQVSMKDLVLAYKVTVYALEPLSRKDYFINASTGKLIGTRDQLHFTNAPGTAATAYSGTQNINSDLLNGSYRLRDLTKGSGVVTLHGENSTHADYTGSSANWSYTTNDKYALDAHYGVSQTYSYYFTKYNRNSINNAGYQLKSYVNETATSNNAYWDGSIMHFGVRTSNSAGITAIDVTAHELTHGLTSNTSKLNYSNESGAINESMSDIFGKTVQFWSKPNDVNWTLSNDMAWNIRNMANPNQFSNPDCYLGTYWYTGTSDNGGVHTNSGVGNYFYYLLVTGGSGTNDLGTAFNVAGLGLDTAGAILYRSETTYLTATSNYAAWRTACINAATDLYGAGSNAVTQVTNAWTAVGVTGTAGGGGGTACTDTWESNNTQSAAKRISSNTDINGNIATSTDVDWFSVVTTSPNTNLKVTLSNLPAGTDYDLKLYNSAGAQLAVSQLSSTNPETIIRNTTTAATYYIKVYPYSGTSSSCYKLRADVSSTLFRLKTSMTDPSETSDATLSVELFPNPAGENITLRCNAVEAGSVNIRMFDLAGQLISSREFEAIYGENKFELGLAGLSNGIYFVEVTNGSIREIGKLIKN